MCTSFMKELMLGNQNLASGGNTFYAALFLTSATVNAATVTYGTTGEVTGTGYTPGGIPVTNGTSPLSTNSTATAGTAYWTPSASLVYTTVTLTTAFDAVLIYNSTNGDKAVSVHTFGNQTVTAGTFTLTMPVNAAATGLIRLATV